MHHICFHSFSSKWYDYLKISYKFRIGNLWKHVVSSLNVIDFFGDLKYRVSHSKEGKVILLWWGYRFWFLLIFWILHVHEIGAFMPNSSVFIYFMFRTLYRMIYRIPKLFFGKNGLNVPNVKLLSKNRFDVFRVFWCFFDFYLWFKVKMYILMVCYFLLLEKGP